MHGSSTPDRCQPLWVRMAHTVGGDELHAGAGGLLQLGFQVAHVRMLVSAMRGSQPLGMGGLPGAELCKPLSMNATAHEKHGD